MTTILGSIFNVIKGTYKWPFREHGKFHFDNKQDVHMDLKNDEESGYNLDLDLLTILYWLSDSYPKRNGVVEK